MRSVGLKALKDKLKEYVRRAASGERFDPGGVVTSRAGILQIDITKTSSGRGDVGAFAPSSMRAWRNWNDTSDALFRGVSGLYSQWSETEARASSHGAVFVRQDYRSP
jgi:hypothetical protein